MVNILFFVQMCTELLPISSSAHVLLFCIFFNITNSLSDQIYAFAHSITAIIILIILYPLLKDWYLTFSFLKKIRDIGLLCFSIMCSFPLLCIKNNFTDIFPIWYGMFITSFILVVLDVIQNYNEKSYGTFWDAFILGVGQGVFALLPGVSRFAGTLLLCRLLNFNKQYSLFVSALLGFAISIAANGYYLFFDPSYCFTIMQFAQSFDIVSIVIFILSVLFATVSFLLFIDGYYTNKMYYFAYYEITVAILHSLLYLL